ncbi:MAG: TetR/AcrR family transcriptional regulator [Solirubrobacteraceae bacterium]|nr:TetR/AcrR family transcriptional regulator [Patulibacter sp.]
MPTDADPVDASQPARRRLLSRQHVLDAARAIVTERGYRGASVAAIATQAGISNGALYRYFPSKVDLFVEVFRNVCDGEMRAATRAASKVQEPLAKLDAMLVDFATRALSNPTLAWALLAEPVDVAVEEVRMEYRLKYRQAIERLLDRAVDAGTIPPQDTVITAAALLGGGNEVLAGPLSPLSDSGRDAATAIAELRRMTYGAVHTAALGADGLA